MTRDCLTLGCASPSSLRDVHGFLEELDLGLPSLEQSFSDEATRRTTDALRAVVLRCPRLRKLSLRNRPWSVDDSVLRAISASCGEHLRHADLSFCMNVQQPHVLNCPNLTSLDLTYCCGTNDANMAAVADLMPNLETVDLSDCYLVSDVGVRALGSNGRLSSISVARCYGVTDTSIISLANDCSATLTNVNLTSCRILTNAAIDALAKCKRHPKLVLYHCYKITDVAIKGYQSRMALRRTPSAGHAASPRGARSPGGRAPWPASRA